MTRIAFLVFWASVLFGAPVFADGAMVAPRQVVIALPPALPPAIAQGLAAADAALHAAAQQVGVQLGQVPPAWLQTTAGKVVVGVLLGIAACLVVAEAGIAGYEATHRAP